MIESCSYNKCLLPMSSGISGFKVFHYSQREKKKTLTAKVAKERRKARMVLNQSNQKTANYRRT
jgi:hypothetical protein